MTASTPRSSTESIPPPLRAGVRVVGGPDWMMDRGGREQSDPRRPPSGVSEPSCSGEAPRRRGESGESGESGGVATTISWANNLTAIDGTLFNTALANVEPICKLPSSVQRRRRQSAVEHSERTLVRLGSQKPAIPTRVTTQGSSGTGAQPVRANPIRTLPAIPTLSSTTLSAPPPRPLPKSVGAKTNQQHYRKLPRSYRSPSPAPLTSPLRPPTQTPGLAESDSYFLKQASGQTPLPRPSSEDRSEAMKGATLANRPGSSRGAKIPWDERPGSSSGRLFSALGLRPKSKAGMDEGIKSISDPIPMSMPTMRTVPLHVEQQQQQSSRQTTSRASTAYPPRVRNSASTKTVDSQAATATPTTSSNNNTGRLTRRSVQQRPGTASSNQSEVARTPSLLTFTSQSSASGAAVPPTDQPLNAEYIPREEADEKEGDIWDEDYVCRSKTATKWKSPFGRSKEKRGVDPYPPSTAPPSALYPSPSHYSSPRMSRSTPSLAQGPRPAWLPVDADPMPSSKAPFARLDQTLPSQASGIPRRAPLRTSQRPQTAQQEATKAVAMPHRPESSRGAGVAFKTETRPGAPRSKTTGPVVQSQYWPENRQVPAFGASGAVVTAAKPSRRPGTAQAAPMTRSSPALLTRPGTSGGGVSGKPQLASDPLTSGTFRRREAGFGGEAINRALKGMVPFKPSMVQKQMQAHSEVSLAPEAPPCRQADRPAPPAADVPSTPLLHVLGSDWTMGKSARSSSPTTCGPLFEALKEEALEKERRETQLLSPANIIEAPAKRLSAHVTVRELRKTMRDLEEAMDCSLDTDARFKMTNRGAEPGAHSSVWPVTPGSNDTNSMYTPGTNRTSTAGLSSVVTTPSMQSVREEDEPDQGEGCGKRGEQVEEVRGSEGGDETVVHCPAVSPASRQVSTAASNESAAMWLPKDGSFDVCKDRLPTASLAVKSHREGAKETVSAKSSLADDSSMCSSMSFSLDDVFCQVQSVEKRLIMAKTAYMTGALGRVDKADKGEDREGRGGEGEGESREGTIEREEAGPSKGDIGQSGSLSGGNEEGTADRRSGMAEAGRVDGTAEREALTCNREETTEEQQDTGSAGKAEEVAETSAPVERPQTRGNNGIGVSVQGRGVDIRLEAGGQTLEVLVNWSVSLEAGSPPLDGFGPWTGAIVLSTADIDAIGRAWFRRKARLSAMSSNSGEEGATVGTMNRLEPSPMMKDLPEDEKKRLDRTLMEERQEAMLRSLTQSSEVRLRSAIASSSSCPSDDVCCPSSGQSSSSAGTFRRKPLYLVNSIPTPEQRSSLEEDVRSDDSSIRSKRYLRSPQPPSPNTTFSTPKTRLSLGHKTSAKVGSLSYNRSFTQLRTGNSSTCLDVLPEEANRGRAYSTGQEYARRQAEERRQPSPLFAATHTESPSDDVPTSPLSGSSDGYPDGTRFPNEHEH